MEDNIWVSGPKELINHGLEHLKKGESFDLRIAMISVDNAIETMIKTFLALNRRTFGISYRQYKNGIQKFPSMLDLLQEFADDKVSADELGKIEFFHNIRNNLYHQGTCITVLKKIVKKYTVLAKDLIVRLFEVKLDIEIDTLTRKFDEFLNVWRELEVNLKNFLLTENLAPYAKKPYRITNILNILYTREKVDINFINKFNNLFKFRNNIVHGVSNVDIDEIANKIQELEKLNDNLIKFMNL